MKLLVVHMFRHDEAPSCKFKDECKWDRCQFRHEVSIMNIFSNNQHSNSLINREKSSGDCNEYSINLNESSKSDEDDDYNSDENESSDEETKLRNTVIETYCEFFCQSTSRFHVHSERDLKMFFGLDLKKTIACFEKGKLTRVLPCDSCEHKTNNINTHETHYYENHSMEVKPYQCIYPKCDFECKSPDEMIEHMVENHAKEVKKQSKYYN